jgi:hypothetical protein
MPDSTATNAASYTTPWDTISRVNKWVASAGQLLKTGLEVHAVRLKCLRPCVLIAEVQDHRPQFQDEGALRRCRSDDPIEYPMILCFLYDVEHYRGQRSAPIHLHRHFAIDGNHQAHQRIHVERALQDLPHERVVVTTERLIPHGETNLHSSASSFIP